MNVRVDTPLCSGCGMCAIVCPEVFRMARRKARKFAVARIGTAEDTVSEFLRIATVCCTRGAIFTDDADRKGVGTTPAGHLPVPQPALSAG
jgi:ferredoxin